MLRIWPGAPQPLGANWDGDGVNVAVFSEHATAVELCLFDDPGARVESLRLPLPERTSHVFHGYFPDLRPGQLYAFRAHGNPKKLLLDPYARAISGPVRWSEALADPGTDSAPALPRCVVVDPACAWGDDRPPRTPWSQTLLYECHVKGMTARHPGVPRELRGTYLGLAQDAVLDHLLALGVTAVQLLPIQHVAVERSLVRAGLSNYWGYNPIGWFAPDARFATGALGQQVREFQAMVKAFHRVGIEVILDVVYNHTGEGDEATGSTLSFRGLDPGYYYHERDFTGCGNSFDASSPRGVQIVLDSLRYWVGEMHVDGFRFDLTTTLARRRADGAFDRLAPFLATLQQDPVLCQVKRIAEPWDLGPDGHQLGRFPSGWSEWNDRYRDTVRRCWRGDPGQVPELASRLAGSSDLFQAADHGPFAGVNFVTCHDGFTLRDLVSYERKHNQANREENRDGSDQNWSRNWGHEGESADPEVRAARERLQRSLLATLAFSQGVPMLSHGDELGRTQLGNNNAYCQDSELTWIDWDLDDSRRELLAFTRRVFEVRRGHPVFRRRRFFRAEDVTWLRPDGAKMDAADWGDPERRVLGVLIPGAATDEVDERGRPQRGESLLLLLNGGHAPQRFALPRPPEMGAWRESVNTADPASTRWLEKEVTLAPHSLLLLEKGPGG